MKKFQKNGLILALLFYFFMGSTRVNAEPETVLSVAPPATAVGQGEAFTVAIDVADVVDLYGFAVRVSFDPAYLQVETPLVLGGFLKSGGFNLINDFNNEEGWVRFDYAQVNPAEPQSGSGTLLVIHFIAREVTETFTTITFEEEGTDPTILSKKDSERIPYTAQDGAVRVTEAPPVRYVYLPLFVYPESDN